MAQWVPVDIGDQSSSEIIAAQAPELGSSSVSTRCTPNTSNPTPATRPTAKSSSTPATTSTPKPLSGHCSTNSASLQSMSERWATAADSCSSTEAPVGPACAQTTLSRRRSLRSRPHSPPRTPGTTSDQWCTATARTPREVNTMTPGVTYAGNNDDPVGLLEITKIADPPPPAPGQIRIDVRAFPPASQECRIAAGSDRGQDWFPVGVIRLRTRSVDRGLT